MPNGGNGLISFSYEKNQMTSKIFIDKFIKPNDQKLRQTLGTSYKYWEELKHSLEDEYGELIEEWKYYGQKIGWTLKLFYKKRNLFFFTAGDKYFRISFVFGDKAVAAIKQSGLPKKLIDEVKNAKKYVEGRGLRIEIKKRNDVNNIKKLVAIKISN